MDRLTTLRLNTSARIGTPSRRRAASSPVVQEPAISVPYHPAVQRGQLVSPPEDVSSPGPAEDAADGSEREQLETQIAAARERTAAAAERSRRREADVRAALRDEIEATRTALAELERAHRAALDLVHEAAELAIERLRAAADDRDCGSDLDDE